MPAPELVSRAELEPLARNLAAAYLAALVGVEINNFLPDRPEWATTPLGEYWYALAAQLVEEHPTAMTGGSR